MTPAEPAQSAIAELSTTQLLIVDEAMRGHKNKEIARALGISPRTVEVQTQRARQALGLRTWLQVVLAVDRERRGVPTAPAIVAERANPACVSVMEPA